jgi:F-type H+-transporting ATPase subunit gamma
VVITPDKGLVGSLNTNLFRKLQDFLREQEELKRETDFIAIGRRAENFLQKNNKKILLSKTGLGDMFVPDEIAEIVETMIHGYTKGPYDKVIMCYTNFFSTLSQKPFIRGILPLTYDKIEDVGDLRTEMAEKLANNDESPEVDYIFEPSKKSVLEELLPRLLDAIIYHNVLEATASEHSARMVAMKSASDNAKDLIDEFTLSYNRLRQEGITKELAEISAASSTI